MRTTRVAALAGVVSVLMLLTACASTSEPSSTPSTSAQDPAEAFDDSVADLPQLDRVDVFAAAEAEGRTGTARKTRPVDARPAGAGEVVVSEITGDGVETVSEPATDGDMVVRNRCEETGNEEILVQAETFPDRYGPAQTTPDEDGYQEHRPLGVEQKYVLVSDDEGEFTMEAPWGELQVFKPGDAIVQNPADETDIYRIYSRSFDCTYEVLEPAT